ncbi:Aste57867_20052 [Aphanomyces stellatus]|uniref:Anaphase-promoting complex subunit 4 n=1 Tax=Aphanomyces stellatus TaxID=120398 RepID=A0A485LE24_9STRA|nr:hypothetical protein As57867_019986 [Aphanomyces stellatus]VFT96748.1 Aste57867_20052 [Aphanomyces stellatus]
MAERDAMRSFSLMRESKGMSATMVQCCPTMDIVAILTKEHHVLVYQSVEWKKLLHIKPSNKSSDILHLAWRRDGRTLAVGRRDGRVILYDVESEPSDAPPPTTDTVHHHDAPIASIYWTEYVPATLLSLHVDFSIEGCDGAKMTDRAPTFIMNPPTSSATSSTELHAKIFTHVATLPKNFHVLVSADTHGTLFFWFFGTVCLARMDTRPVQGNHVIHRVHMPEDLSCVHVAVGDAVVRFDTGALQEHKEQLFVVAHHIRELERLWTTVDTALKQARTEWANGVRVFQAKMQLLQDVYDRFVRPDVPQMHMYTLLCSGLCFPGLEIFFSQYLPEQSIQRMKKAFAHGCDLQDQLSVALTNILFRLGELRGLAKFHVMLHRFGLDVSALSALIASVERLLVVVADTQTTVHTTAIDFDLFLSWCSEMSAYMPSKTLVSTRSAVDTQRLAKFLHRAYTAAHAYRQIHPDKIEVTFGTRVPDLLASLVDGRSQVDVSWQSLWTPAPTLPQVELDRLILPVQSMSVRFGRRWTLCWKDRTLLVFETAALSAPWRLHASATLVDAGMYVRDGASPHVALLVQELDASRAHLQLIEIAVGNKSDDENPVEASRRLGWPCVMVA